MSIAGEILGGVAEIFLGSRNPYLIIFGIILLLVIATFWLLSGRSIEWEDAKELLLKNDVTHIEQVEKFSAHCADDHRKFFSTGMRAGESRRFLVCVSEDNPNVGYVSPI